MKRRINLTITFLSILLFAGSVLTGCVMKSTADAQARAAFIAGQKRGIAMQTNADVVWVVGNVRQPLVPWTAELTLARVIVAAEFLGTGDPSQITIFRNGQAPIRVSSQQILKGFDLPLLAGDRIEIRP